MRDEPRRPRSDLVSYSTEQDRSPQIRDRRQGMYPSTPASSLRNTKNEDLTPALFHGGKLRDTHQKRCVISEMFSFFYYIQKTSFDPKGTRVLCCLASFKPV